MTTDVICSVGSAAAGSAPAGGWGSRGPWEGEDCSREDCFFWGGCGRQDGPFWEEDGPWEKRRKFGGCKREALRSLNCLNASRDSLQQRTPWTLKDCAGVGVAAGPDGIVPRPHSVFSERICHVGVVRYIRRLVPIFARIFCALTGSFTSIDLS